MARNVQTDVAPNDAVQYRPGELFGHVLKEIAAAWRVSRNETARELAVLAAYGFDASYRAPIARLAFAMDPGLVQGPGDFVRACTHVRGSLEVAVVKRTAAGLPPTDDTVKAEIIRQIVEEYTSLTTLACKKAEEVARADVHGTGTPPPTGKE